MRKSRVIELQSPIPNPRPDGRKRNWTGEKEFLPGRYLDDGVSLKRVGKSRYDRVEVYAMRESYDAIIAVAVEVEPHGIKQLLATMGEDSDSACSILGVLLYSNAITPQQIQAAIGALDANENLIDVI